MSKLFELSQLSFPYLKKGMAIPILQGFVKMPTTLCKRPIPEPAAPTARCLIADSSCLSIMLIFLFSFSNKHGKCWTKVRKWEWWVGQRGWKGGCWKEEFWTEAKITCWICRLTRWSLFLTLLCCGVDSTVNMFCHLRHKLWFQGDVRRALEIKRSELESFGGNVAITSFTFSISI